jgi:hypothetical protein
VLLSNVTPSTFYCLCDRLMDLWNVCGAALLVGRSQDQFPVVSLDFSVTYSFRPFHDPRVDPVPSENEYQEHFLGVKVASA